MIMCLWLAPARTAPAAQQDQTRARHGGRRCRRLCCAAWARGRGRSADHVQHWPVYTDVTEFILNRAARPRGQNPEMTLSSRPTAANLGRLDDPADRRDRIVSNLAVVQIQAIVVAPPAAIAAPFAAAFHRSLTAGTRACCFQRGTASLSSGLPLAMSAVVVLRESAASRQRRGPDRGQPGISAGDPLGGSSLLYSHPRRPVARCGRPGGICAGLAAVLASAGVRVCRAGRAWFIVAGIISSSGGPC